MKILTFIIPAYNSEKYICRCLDSFLTEDNGRSFDVLIVIDGSEDGTYDLCRRYVEVYPELFQTVVKENGGHGSVINEALHRITSKYFKVIDADDWVDTGQLMHFCTELAGTDADTVLTNYRMINTVSGKVTNWRTYLKDYEKEYTLSELNGRWKDVCRCFTFHGITYQTDFYRRYGIRLTEHVYYEDQEFAAIPLCCSRSMKVLNMSIYQYRVGEPAQSVSTQSRLRQLDHTDQVLQCLLEYYEDHQDRLDEAGCFCLEMKIAAFAQSHLVMLMLGAGEEGGRAAHRLAAKLKDRYGSVYQILKNKYFVLRALRFFRVNYGQWEKVYESRFYNLLRGNHDYE